MRIANVIIIDTQTFEIRSYSRVVARRSTHERIQKVGRRHVGGGPGVVLLGIHNSETSHPARSQTEVTAQTQELNPICRRRSGWQTHTEGTGETR